ncbi:MAG: leucine-rich repeat domain-containing protein [Phocaeicola vulgatus]|nr:MAG: leucine-rich repeat domain-containing protein [Phocaeicola vulgatus]
MKRRLTVLFALLVCLVGSVQAQLSKTVELTEAGTLEAQLGEDVGKITELIVKGPLNEADFVTMKEKMKSIQVLDMGGVTELPFENRWVDGTRVPFSVIPSSAFERKQTLRKVVFPPVVEYIYPKTFLECSNLVEVDFSLAENLKKILDDSFSGCNNLKNIDLSKCANLKHFSGFSGCANLSKVDLSGCNNLEEIGIYSFSGCENLNEVVLNGCVSLKRIGYQAFYYNRKLSYMDFSSCPLLEEIGEQAFYEANISGEVVLGENITKIGERAFALNRNITSVDFSNCSKLVVIGNEIFDGCNVKSVDFTSCLLLNTITPNAFGKSLEEYVIDNGFYKSIDGVLFNAETNTLLNYPSSKKNESYEIPSSVVSINDNAFDGNSNLKKLVIPSSVKSIGCQDLGFLKLYMQSPTPIALSGEISNEGERMPVYVPKGSGEAYRNAPIWKDYVIIEEGADPITITLSAAGTLQSELEKMNVKLNEISELVVAGSMNDDDLRIIAQMHYLSKLDLRQTDLDEFYLIDWTSTSKHFPYYELKEILLPNIIRFMYESYSFSTDFIAPLLRHVNFSELINLKRIGENAFSHTSLNKIDLSNTKLDYIRSRAFYGCKIISPLSFPSTLQQIEREAFYNATPEYIKLKSPNMVRCGKNAFASADFENCKLYVLKGLKSIYQADPEWGKFKNIIEFGQQVKVTSNEQVGCCYMINGSGCYEEGETVLLEIANDDESLGTFLFEGWYENGEKLSSEMRYSFEIGNKDRNIEARFIAVGCFCNIGNVNIISNDGKKMKLQYTKPQGDDWVFLGWYEGSTCLSKDFELTIEAGKENRTIEARCSTKQMNIHGNEVVITDNEKIEGAEVQFYGKYMTIEGEKAWNMKRFVYRHPRSIVVDSDVKAEEIEFLVESLGNEWSFISLPYNCKVSELAQNNPDVQFVVREYDGKSRATNGIGTSWKQLTQADEMQANKGYILRADRYQTFDLSSSDVSGMNTLFNRKEVTIPLNTYSSASVLDANWNLVGNPYPAYYRLEQLYADGLDATVTVWSPEINNYEYYTADDKDVFLKPYTAFFVQKNTSNLKFVPEGRVAVPDTTNNLRSAGDRQIINLVLANESRSDRTRIVFNEAASLEYELGKDAAKFASMKTGSPSLYSFDGQNHSLAINERPKADGIVRLGVAITEKGTYTLSLKEAIATDLKLVDKVTGSVCDLATSNYEFEAEVGTYNDRFELRSGVATANEMIDSSVRCVIRDGQLIINGLSESAMLSVYDAAGKNYYQGKVTNGEIRLGNHARGIYYLRVVTLDGKQIIRSIKW